MVAPVHDALLIEAPVNEIDHHIALTEDAMRKASRYVLNGFELRTDRKVVTHPDRFMESRGQVMWSIVTDVLGELQNSGATTDAYFQQ